MRNKVISAREAANLIKDNSVVSISSSSGLGCPDHVLKGTAMRFPHPSRMRFMT